MFAGYLIRPIRVTDISSRLIGRSGARSGPAESPLTVVADSTDEALAALACIFESETVRPLNTADRVIVVKSAEALSKIASAATDFIVVMGVLYIRRLLSRVSADLGQRNADTDRRAGRRYPDSTRQK